MNRSGLAFVLVAALGSGAATGCYTLLRHPAAVVPDESTGDKTCADCHAQSDLYHWDYGSYGYYGSNLTPWSPYYLRPWWCDTTYWPPSPGSGLPVDDIGRHAWDRGPGSPDPHPIGGTVQPSPVVTPVVTPPATDPNANPPAEPPPPPPKKDEHKRNSWGR